MKQWRVGTISAGVILISLGILLIIEKINGMYSVGRVIKWWPVILIILGCEILVFSFLSRKDDSKLKFDGMSIFIIFMVLIFCFGTNVAMDVFGGVIHRDGLNFSLRNYKYESKFKKNITVNAKGKDKLILNNAYGNTKVIKGKADNIEIEADIIIRNNDEKHASEIVDSLIEVKDENPISIKSKIDMYKNNDIQDISINYLIKVPENMNIDIDS